MGVDASATVKAVQESVVTLLGLVDQAARVQGADVEDLHDEAQKTVLMMIAGIVMADEKYADGEKAFISLLVDWSSKPGGEMRYLEEYAKAWEAASLQVPRFFELAAEYDKRHGTDLARGMIREIQLIGNTTSMSDGEYEAMEQELVHRYVVFLEAFMKAWNAEATGAGDKPAQGWENV